MATYTYEEVYSDPKKAIIRTSADANIVGLRNGHEVTVVCDRKWGEHNSIVVCGFISQTSETILTYNKDSLGGTINQ